MHASCLNSRGPGLRHLLRCGLLVLWFSLARDLLAQRNQLKPSDFEPLTSLPWKQEGATLKSVLGAIFRETNHVIRYPALGAYLRQLPVEQLEPAFDFCIDLEGTQVRDQLVAFYLPIWAERDPVKCWTRTKQLFHVVGIEDGWLDYDSWAGRSRITVQDIDAIRHSRFWLGGWSLARFPLGLEKSSLPKEERVRMMKEFAETWFAAFSTWPESSDRERYPGVFEVFDPSGIFGRSTESLQNLTPANVSFDEVAFEVGVRRWLEGEPAAAPEIVKSVYGAKWPGKEVEPREPSTELLLVWAKADLPGMIRWVESPDSKVDWVKPLTTQVRAFLMSRVDDATRQRWLAEADGQGPDGAVPLLEGWAGWDPKPALAAAVARGDSEIMRSVSFLGAYGPFDNSPFNASHYGLGVIEDFDVAGLPEKLRKDIVGEWGITIMEQWGDIDIGEAARYGLDFLLRSKVEPRENLIKLFSGDDAFASDGGMTDRTFCALRGWAVVRPQEMETWIATIKDQEMRVALSWMLKNPWGGPKK